MEAIQIAGRRIAKSEPAYLIAEAGVNHCGRLDLALKLIDAAARAGADAVKFQSYRTEELILPGIGKADYQRESGTEEDQRTMLGRLAIDANFHRALIAHCRKRQITFLSTPYDSPSLKLLLELKLPAIKIASTDTTNQLFLQEVACCGLPVILSTGMSTKAEILAAIATLKKGGCQELAVLKCTSNYPTADHNVNLRAMEELELLSGCITGFSDHTPGVGASPVAAAREACIIEKHFTLDKSLEGPDHKASLDPRELDQWVQAIRRVETLLGKNELGHTASERETRKSLQKSLICTREMKAGSKLNRETLAARRTGGQGISAFYGPEILGRQLRTDLCAGQPLQWEDLLP